MRKIRRILLVALVMISSNYAFSQMDKESCETFLKQIDVTVLKNGRINFGEGENSQFNLNIKTVKFEFNEKYLVISDGPDMKTAIPYSKINCIYTSTGNDKRYALLIINIEN